MATLPKLPKDGSDRNRTSPFAFTGNKFEFRMVGSSASVAVSSYVLNTIVADALREFADRLENCDDFDAEILSIVKDTVEQHGRIVFNGNNYTDEWVEEAARRGLPNLANTVDAVEAAVAPKNIELMERLGVMTPVECESRYEMMLENYCKVVNIEGAAMAEMTRRQILPAATDFAGKTAASYNALSAAGIKNDSIFRLLARISERITNVEKTTGELEKALLRCEEAETLRDNARMHRDEVRSIMLKLRREADDMERLISDEAWPIPTYADLLYRI